MIDAPGGAARRDRPPDELASRHPRGGWTPGDEAPNIDAWCIKAVVIAVIFGFR